LSTLPTSNAWVTSITTTSFERSIELHDRRIVAARFVVAGKSHVVGNVVVVGGRACFDVVGIECLVVSDVKEDANLCVSFGTLGGVGLGRSESNKRVLVGLHIANIFAPFGFVVNSKHGSSFLDPVLRDAEGDTVRIIGEDLNVLKDKGVVFASLGLHKLGRVGLVAIHSSSSGNRHDGQENAVKGVAHHLLLNLLLSCSNCCCFCSSK